jgi:hypothetical protein
MDDGAWVGWRGLINDLALVFAFLKSEPRNWLISLDDVLKLVIIALIITNQSIHDVTSVTIIG